MNMAAREKFEILNLKFESKRTAFKTSKDLSTSNRKNNFTQTARACNLEQNCLF